MRKYLCLENDNHTPQTEGQIQIADEGICPFCGAQMVGEDYPNEE